MRIPTSILFVPVLVFISACSTHYSASSHHYRHSHSHVSVGVHGHYHGGGRVLGALIVGGIIGHMLTEAAHHEEESQQRQVVPPLSSDEDELVNGYPLEQKATPVSAEQQRFYQLGDDDRCYLMEEADGEPKIIAMVPRYSCN